MTLNRLIVYSVYSLPHMVVYWLYAGIMIAQGIYAKYFGLGLTAIAAVLLIARLFDAVSDPVIGFLSDLQRRRWGTRKPMMIAGGLLILVAAYFLFVPMGVDVAGVSAGQAQAKVGIVYFAFFFILYYLAMTLFEMPHLAWAGELAPGSRDKTTIYGVRGAWGKLGSLLFYAIPLLPFLSSREITPQTLQLSVLLAGAIMLPALFFMAVSTPNGAEPVARPSRDSRRHVVSDIRLLVRSVANNRPLLIFVLVYLSSGIAMGVWISLLFIYVDTYLGLGEYFAQASLAGSIAALAAVPIYIALGQHFDKKWVWFGGKALHLVTVLVVGLLTPENTTGHILTALLIVQSAAIACSPILGPAIMSEIADYGALKSREEHTASYFSVYVFSLKLTYAFGGAIGLGVAGLFGFDPSLTQHTAHSVLGLKLAVAVIPTVLLLVGLVFTAALPIDNRRHAIIRKRLDQRRERLGRTGVAAATQPARAAAGWRAAPSRGRESQA